jgi:hypothetical protein
MERLPHFTAQQLSELVDDSCRVEFMLDFIAQQKVLMKKFTHVINQRADSGHMRDVSLFLTQFITCSTPEQQPEYEFEISDTPRILAQFLPQNLVENYYITLQAVLGFITSLRQVYVATSFEMIRLAYLASRAFEQDEDGPDLQACMEKLRYWKEHSEEAKKCGDLGIQIETLITKTQEQ